MLCYYLHTMTTTTAAGRLGGVRLIAAAVDRPGTKSTEFRHGISIAYTHDELTLCRRFVGQYEIFILEIIFFFTVPYRPVAGTGNYRPTAVRHWSVLFFSRRRLLRPAALQLGERFSSRADDTNMYNIMYRYCSCIYRYTTYTGTGETGFVLLE